MFIGFKGLGVFRAWGLWGVGFGGSESLGRLRGF